MHHRLSQLAFPWKWQPKFPMRQIPMGRYSCKMIKKNKQPYHKVLVVHCVSLLTLATTVSAMSTYHRVLAMHGVSVGLVDAGDERVNPCLALLL